MRIRNDCNFHSWNPSCEIEISLSKVKNYLKNCQIFLDSAQRLLSDFLKIKCAISQNGYFASISFNSSICCKNGWLASSPIAHIRSYPVTSGYSSKCFPTLRKSCEPGDPELDPIAAHSSSSRPILFLDGHRRLFERWAAHKISFIFVSKFV